MESGASVLELGWGAAQWTRLRGPPRQAPPEARKGAKESAVCSQGWIVNYLDCVGAGPFEVRPRPVHMGSLASLDDGRSHYPGLAQDTPSDDLGRFMLLVFLPRNAHQAGPYSDPAFCASTCHRTLKHREPADSSEALGKPPAATKTNRKRRPLPAFRYLQGPFAGVHC